MRDDFASYTASLNAVLGLWPEDLQNAMRDAAAKATDGSQCIFVLGARTLPLCILCKIKEVTSAEMPGVPTQIEKICPTGNAVRRIRAEEESGTIF